MASTAVVERKREVEDEGGGGGGEWEEERKGWGVGGVVSAIVASCCWERFGTRGRREVFLIYIITLIYLISYYFDL